MELFNVVYRGKDTVELKYGSVYKVERRYVRRGEKGGTRYKLKGVEGEYSDNLFQEPKENRPSHIAVLRDSNPPTYGKPMEHLMRCEENGVWVPVFENELVTGVNIIYGNLYAVHTKKHTYFVQHCPYKMQTSEETIDEETNVEAGKYSSLAIDIVGVKDVEKTTE